MNAVRGLLAAALALGALLAPTPLRAETDVPVGRILSPKGPLCTGVLVAPRAVLTAAHCLTTKAGDGFYSAGLIHFAMPDPESGATLYALGESVERSPAFTPGAKPSPQNFAKDWALLRLDREIAAPPVPLWPHWRAALPPHPDLFAVAYGRARTLAPSVRRKNCAIASQKAPLLFHTCAVEKGSSGSVLFLRTETGAQVLAINVGLTKGPATRAHTVARLVPEEVAALLAED